MQHPCYEVIVIKTRGSVRKLVVVTSVAKTIMLFTLRRKGRMYRCWLFLDSQVNS